MMGRTHPRQVPPRGGPALGKVDILVVDLEVAPTSTTVDHTLAAANNERSAHLGGNVALEVRDGANVPTVFDDRSDHCVGGGNEAAGIEMSSRTITHVYSYRDPEANLSNVKRVGQCRSQRGTSDRIGPALTTTGSCADDVGGKRPWNGGAVCTPDVGNTSVCVGLPKTSSAGAAGAGPRHQQGSIDVVSHGGAANTECLDAACGAGHQEGAFDGTECLHR
jgi:hypothetical protein